VNQIKSQEEKGTGKKVSVILATYNEKENIGPLITDVYRLVGKSTEVIVVDDNSPDKTWEIVENLKKLHPTLKLIRRIGLRGLPSAIMTGIRASTGDIVVWLDADLSMPASLIPVMLGNIPPYDIAIGSRYAKGGRDVRPFGRRLTSRLICGMATLILGYGIRDYDTGFVAARKSVFSIVRFPEKGYGEYCIAFLYRAAKKGFKIKEIGFTFTDRKMGKSKTGEKWYSYFRHGYKYISQIIKLRLEK
jgi:dolichol-phosphate mannosyltransferase